MLNSVEVEDLNGILKPLADFSEADLCERQKWGDINFTEVRAEIESATGIARELLSLPLTVLPTGTQQRLANVVPTLTSVLQQIDTFSLQISDPTSHRNQLCANVRQSTNDLEVIAQSIIPFLRMQGSDFKASEKTLKEQATAVGDLIENSNNQTKALFRDVREGAASQQLQAEEFLKDMRNRAQEQQERTEEVLKNAEAAGARIAVGKFTELFSDEADAQRKRSRAWLSATAAFGLAALASAICFYLNPLLPESASAWQVAGHIGSRGAILAVLFTGAVWCGRVYRALLHQATTNKHRALSLQTFKSFVDATEKPEIKDVILLAATNASFGNTTTGLVDQKGSEGFATSLYEATRNLKQGE